VKKTFLLAASVLALNSSLSMAQVTTQFELPASFKKLHVTIPTGCPIIERPGADEGETGPYLRTYTCTEAAFQGVKSLTGTVYRVVDGDTVHFFYKGKLYATRMLGMDTPELHYVGKAQPVWGVKARNNLRKMVSPGDTIRAEFDQVKCDRYGRMLVHLFKGNVNLNYEQVKAGLAANYCIAPNFKYCEEFATAYRQAAQANLGIHADRCVVTPYVWRRAIENNPMDKNVKDSVTGITYTPSQYYQVPVANRIFYMPSGTAE
jgi:endonuclease YncB( thermonuclease family)